MTNIKILFLVFIIKTAGCLATRNFPGPHGEAGEQGACSLPAGAMGDPGDEGFPGPRGLKGDKGEPASRFDRPRPGEECRCPIGPPGTKGEPGDVGIRGTTGPSGAPGLDGVKGAQGPPGSPGVPGIPAPSLPRYPPTTADTMYIPVSFNGIVPRTMCHHISKKTYVPGVPHDWLGWYETGRSSFLTFDKWLYFSSRFQCPCSIPIPPGPTPSPSELLRLL